MKVEIGRHAAVVSDSSLLRLLNRERYAEGGDDIPVFDKEYAMNVLKNDPVLGARLIYLCRMDHDSVFWTGDDAGSIGVRLIQKPNATEAAGTNLFGSFLFEVARDYHEYIRENPVNDSFDVRRDVGKVITDFTRTGDFDTDVTMNEQDGRKYVHTDFYRPKRFSFDTNLSGTTGHARRGSDTGIATNTFVCPFGTEYPAKVRVGSAAEASYLFECGIRGELDYEALVTSLENRQLLKKLSRYDRETLVRDLRGQFDWIREQLCTNPDIIRQDVVASSALVPDDSFGRSVYDMEKAPSPAHVLSRYIQNPVLLFSPSENIVLRALSTPEKDEPERFNVPADTQVVRIAVVGSDTVGGRQVGRKAVERSVLDQSTDEEGRTIIKRSRRFDMPMKSDKEISADYAAFAARMDSILEDIPEGTRIELWTGGSSSDLGKTGTPRLVERYVREKHGLVAGWNFEQGGLYQRAAGDASKISVVSMDFFNKCYPVLLGMQHEAGFYKSLSDQDSFTTFSESPAVSMDGVVCFTVPEARDNSLIESLGSLAVTAGKPVIHVNGIRSEKEQREQLVAGADTAYRLLTGGQEFGASLFQNGVKRNWDLGSSTVLSRVDREAGVAVPLVMERFDGVVPVGSVSYHTPFGAFVAMMAKEAGRDTFDDLNDILRAEERPMLLLASYRNYSKGISPEVEERCMRSAVRMMAGSDTRFASMLMETQGEIVLPDSLGEGRLFVDLDGAGENRFGVVLSAERDYAVSVMEERRVREEQERQQVLEENARRQKLEVQRRAPGEKVQGGLPERAEGYQGAVWLVGTAEPSAAALADDQYSFVPWDDMNGQEPLVREVVSRPNLSDGVGGEVPNDYVFLYPTNLSVFTGKDRLYNRGANSRELHDCQRVDAVTGEKFVCAYGIPVKMNKFYNELHNESHLPCSFRLDDKASEFVDSIVLTDALARTAAIRHKASLCVVARTGADGELWFPISYVFGPKAYIGGKWVENPHSAPVCARNLDRYMSMLNNGRHFPLNCIPLPAESYDFLEGNEESKEAALRRLVSDLNFALKIANSTALQLGVPLRIPLDKDGHVDLGPGIPEVFRDAVEKRVNAFIGVVAEEAIAEGKLPVLERGTVLDYAKNIGKMRTAQDVYLRPNDLVFAFGPYDFTELRSGSIVPLHEMVFKTEDGNVFCVRDASTNRGKTNEEINEYINYERNDLRRWVIRCTDPDKSEEFVAALKAYIDRAKKLSVEYRLLRDSEPDAKDLGMDGYIVVRSSNDRDFISSSDVSSDEVSRMKHLGEAAALARKKGISVKEAYENLGFAGDDRGPILVGRETDIFNTPNRFDGNDGKNDYDGWVDAKDSFSGYVQVKFRLPDGAESEWTTLTDPKMVKEITMFTLNRTYRTDAKPLILNGKLLQMFLTAEAAKIANGDLRLMEDLKPERVEEDLKVVDAVEQPVNEPTPVREAPVNPADEEKPERKSRVYVSFWGNKDIPEDAFLVQASTSRPKGIDVDVEFQSAYPVYETMVAPHKAGEIDDAEYARRYKESVLVPNGQAILDGVQKMKELADGQDIFIMCYCRPGAFCHRYLLNNYLNENGIECQEYPGDRIMYTKGHVALYGEEGYSEETMILQTEETPKDKALGNSSEARSFEPVFTVSEGGYSRRTFENANAPDVDFTLQFAVDFNTPGERATAKAADESLIPVQLPLVQGEGLDFSDEAIKSCVDTIVNFLPEEFLNGQEVGFNLAGNGMYTLSKKGITQDQMDDFLCRVHLGLMKRGVTVQSYRSGGQSGVDASAVAIGKTYGIPVSIHAPKGWVYRDEKGKDISGEKSFKERFTSVRAHKVTKVNKSTGLGK